MKTVVTFLFVALAIISCSKKDETPAAAPTASSYEGFWKRSSGTVDGAAQNVEVSYLHITKTYFEAAKPGATVWADKTNYTLNGDKAVASFVDNGQTINLEITVSNAGGNLNASYTIDGKKIVEVYVRATDAERAQLPTPK